MGQDGHTCMASAETSRNSFSLNAGRIRWVSGRPGEAPAYAGTDFIIVRNGRIAAVYLFFDKLPETFK